MDFCSLLQITTSAHALNILLPVGISFYTFSAISYIFDCYTGKIESTDDFIAGFLYLSFFPAILSGPIHKAEYQLPQYLKQRDFDYGQITAGLKSILWGVFIKLVIADRLGNYVDTVYANIEGFSGTTLTIAAFFYTFQIYADFAGYSLIAIGCGELFGIRLQENFKRPYLSKTITEFWSRWHISLTSFFRNYLYFPLGGNRVSRSRWIANILIVFLISGLWHGASYTFIIWGALHGIIQVVEKLVYGDRIKKLDNKFSIGNILRVFVTFSIVTLAWVFFRSASVADAWTVVKGIVGHQNLLDIYWGNEGRLQFLLTVRLQFLLTVLLVAVLCCQDIISESCKGIVEYWNGHKAVRWIAYYVICALIIILGMNSGESFIYYQF